MTFPRLKTFLSVFPISDTSWGVRGGTDEHWRITLTDARAIHAFGALLPYLDGQTTTDDILQALEGGGIQRGVAAAVLRQLESASLLEERDAGGLSDAELSRFEDQIRFFSRFTQQGGARHQATLRDSRVALIADDGLGESVYGRLANAGLGEVVIISRQRSTVMRWIDRIADPLPATTVHDLDLEVICTVDDTTRPRLLIVCQTAHDPQLLEAVDAWSKQHGVAWLLIRSLELQEGWVGPLFVPGETASYLSLEARERTAMSRFREYLAFDAHVRATERPPAFGGLSAAFDLLASVAVIEVIKFVTEIKVPELLGKFLTINPWTWDTELHEVLRVPALDRQGASRPSVFPWSAGIHANQTTTRDV